MLTKIQIQWMAMVLRILNIILWRMLNPCAEVSINASHEKVLEESVEMEKCLQQAEKKYPEGV